MSEFANPKYPGFCMLMSPFADDDSRRLLERLRFWAKERGERGDMTLFSDKLKAYRALKERPKPAPVLEHRPSLKRTKPAGGSRTSRRHGKRPC